MSVKLPFASAVVEIDVPLTVMTTPDVLLAPTFDIRMAEWLALVTPEIVPRIVVPLDEGIDEAVVAVLGAIGDAL